MIGEVDLREIEVQLKGINNHLKELKEIIKKHFDL